MLDNNLWVLRDLGYGMFDERAIQRGELTVIKDGGKYHIFFKKGTFSKPKRVATVARNRLAQIDGRFERRLAKRIKSAIEKIIIYDQKFQSANPHLNITKAKRKGKWTLVNGNPEYANEVSF